MCKHEMIHGSLSFGGVNQKKYRGKHDSIALFAVGIIRYLREILHVFGTLHFSVTAHLECEPINPMSMTVSDTICFPAQASKTLETNGPFRKAWRYILEDFPF